MKNKILFTTLGLFMGLLIAGVLTFKVEPVQTNLNADKLFSIIQNWRTENKLPDYETNETVCKIAAVRLEEIKTDYSHNQFIPTVKLFLDGTKYYVAENLINQPYQSEQKALDAWLLSPEHHENLESSYKYSCVKTDNSYAVQIFANF